MKIFLKRHLFYYFLALSIGVIDLYTGAEISFSIFYLIPIYLYTRRNYTKIHPGILISVFSAIIWFLADILNNTQYFSQLIPFWNALVRLTFFIVVVFLSRSLHIKNDHLSSINKRLEILNNSMINSINYGKIIQDAILPSNKMMSKLFPDSFVFLKPKDIVSGDFYWVYDEKDQIIFVVADATGHGVPGAFMSMIGFTLLNKIVIESKTFDPSKILSKLNSGINSMNREKETFSDGMDVSVICFNKLTNTITISSANNYVFAVQDNQVKLLQGSIYSLGGDLSSKKELDFSNTIIDGANGLSIYLTTDGFIDQYGGPNNKKLGIDNFIKIISELQETPINNQLEIITRKLNDWKNKQRQTDDILVVGIKNNFTLKLS